MKIIIVRDPRESPKKCSLIPLKGRSDVEFISYVKDREVPVGEVILLETDAPPLTHADSGKTLLVLDSSWRHLFELRKVVRGELTPRSIPPGFVTAYPRKSKLYQDPSAGLASIEALFIAKVVMGETDLGLLDAYYWKDEFLQKNKQALARFQLEANGDA